MCCKYDRWLWGGKLVGKIRQKQVGKNRQAESDFRFGRRVEFC